MILLSSVAVALANNHSARAAPFDPFLATLLLSKDIFINFSLMAIINAINMNAMWSI